MTATGYTKHGIQSDSAFDFSGAYLKVDGTLFGGMGITWNSDLYVKSPKNSKVVEGILREEDGTKATSILILQRDLTEKLAVISDVAQQVYTGSPLKPKVTVTWDGTQLTEGKDYTLTYQNNTAAGTASVTVAGAGQFSGSVKKSFAIIKKTTLKSQKVTVKKKTVILEAAKTKTYKSASKKFVLTVKVR